MAITPEQQKTLSLLLPNAVPTTDMIVPRGNLPEQLAAEIVSGDAVKLLSQGTLLFAMAQTLEKSPKCKLEPKDFKAFVKWYHQETFESVVQEGVDGEAGVGGTLPIIHAKGKIHHQRNTKVRTEHKAVRDIRDLLSGFNLLVEKSTRASKRRLVFIVDDIDKVQDPTSIENTFIHAAHFMGQISCPCIFTVPITYATSGYLRMASLYRLLILAARSKEAAVKPTRSPSL